MKVGISSSFFFFVCDNAGIIFLFYFFFCYFHCSALRKFLSTFRISGESQKIYRIMECFGDEYLMQVWLLAVVLIEAIFIFGFFFFFFVVHPCIHIHPLPEESRHL
jgi:hypothetical protein